MITIYSFHFLLDSYFLDTNKSKMHNTTVMNMFICNKYIQNLDDQSYAKYDIVKKNVNMIIEKVDLRN